MTYSDYENSVASGSPFFLYLFDDGVTATRLAASKEDITAMTYTWVASPVSHGDMQQTGNIERSDLDLNFPLSDTMARTFLSPNSTSTSVTIWRGHRDDPDEEFRVVWKGRIMDAVTDEDSIKIVVESIFTSMHQTGCRAKYQRLCRHSLYFPGCNLDLDDFKIAAVASASSGLTLTVAVAAAQANGFYKAGLVIYNGKYGWITSHVGSQITLITEIDGLVDAIDIGPTNIEIARGCDLSKNTCNTKFANGLNHGGFPDMSDVNPFTSSIL